MNLYIIAGCNGAGKTTASFTMLPEMLKCREFVNADEIAAGLSPFNPEGVAIQAGRLMIDRIIHLLKEGESFAFETTLATRSYVKLIQQAQRRGYFVTLIFFMLNGNNGQPVSGLSQEYKNVVSAPLIQFTTGSGAKISIPWYVLYAVLFVILMWFIWNKTAFGKNMFAVGSNADAAKVSGVNVFWTTVMVHTLAGAMYGVTGFIEGARISSITQGAGLNYECDAIAACVIGGVSFVGGTGKVSGIVLGVFVLRIIFVALSMLGIDPSMQYIIKGGIILAACSLDMRKYLAKK